MESMSRSRPDTTISKMSCLSEEDPRTMREEGWKKGQAFTACCRLEDMSLLIQKRQGLSRCSGSPTNCSCRDSACLIAILNNLRTRMSIMVDKMARQDADSPSALHGEYLVSGHLQGYLVAT